MRIPGSPILNFLLQTEYLLSKEYPENFFWFELIGRKLCSLCVYSVNAKTELNFIIRKTIFRKNGHVGPLSSSLQRFFQKKSIKMCEKLICLAKSKICFQFMLSLVQKAFQHMLSMKKTTFCVYVPSMKMETSCIYSV